MMYAAPNRRTTHRLAKLDVPVPSWFRAPGEFPGMFGPEVAMDELAERLGIDPVELRSRNEPDVDPDSGKRFSSRNLIPASARAPCGSAGPTATRGPASETRAAGWSAPASPRRCTRPTGKGSPLAGSGHRGRIGDEHR
jgi:xanthine dehydrogenase YagR molybdenum-binding subunit